MLKLVLILLGFLAITLLVLGASEVISSAKNDSGTKMSPFECGFDSRSLSRKPFSVHFFFSCIVFLIFDVELLLLIPLVGKSMSSNTLGLLGVTALLILTVFLLGLAYEWAVKSLEWFS